jgi:hypothetical protein
MERAVITESITFKFDDEAQQKRFHAALETGIAPNPTRVWIVVEVDRGMGPSVSGVYATEESAVHSCGGNEFVSGPHDLQNSTP